MDPLTTAHLTELAELETALIADDEFHRAHPHYTGPWAVLWVSAAHPYGNR